MWYRVFGTSDREIAPVQVVERLHADGFAVVPHFRGDDLGWSSATLSLTGLNTPVSIDRYLAVEDEIRDDLNTFAALLETCDYSPNNRSLMEHVALSRQMIVIRKPLDASDEIVLENLLVTLCQLFASAIDGIYQIDSQGWFDSQGHLLLEEY